MKLIVKYPSKKALKEATGSKLTGIIETSLFGPQYRDNGKLVVCNRPHITGIGREWFAEVTLKDGVILKVT